jgi:YVTN family beta-propeller protein
MIGLLGIGGVGRKQEKAGPGRVWRATAVLGMLAAAGVTAAPAAAAPIGYTITATIAMNNPIAVGEDPSTHALYVTNGASGTISVIDETTNTVTATIPVAIAPDAVGVDPSTHIVYVASEGTGSNTVSVIDEATNTVTATIPVAIAPDAVGVDPFTHTVYVANEGTASSLSVIDGATNTVTATIGVGQSAGGWRWTRPRTPST